jgi:hypothetical protein
VYVVVYPVLGFNTCLFSCNNVIEISVLSYVGCVDLLGLSEYQARNERYAYGLLEGTEGVK